MELPSSSSTPRGKLKSVHASSSTRIATLWGSTSFSHLRLARVGSARWLSSTSSLPSLRSVLRFITSSMPLALRCTFIHRTISSCLSTWYRLSMFSLTASRRPGSWYVMLSHFSRSSASSASQCAASTPLYSVASSRNSSSRESWIFRLASSRSAFRRAISSSIHCCFFRSSSSMRRASSRARRSLSSSSSSCRLRAPSPSMDFSCSSSFPSILFSRISYTACRH
mmetsp:Transcript_34874/g.110159  ORF Transcript_34874/g.110159 Transcript_34874/m.110159 type:complete len:225 (+) Transcript_34874:1398-2072(+)